MPTVDITITITTPPSVTAAQALTWATNQRGYNPALGESRVAMYKRVLAEDVIRDVRNGRRAEVLSAAEAGVPDDITAA